MREKLRDWAAPAIPFFFSLGLSLASVGSQVHWQDSGFFLSAVHDVGILYPPGFVLYLLLCKAWTVLFFFLDFALAVHLFSSVCAALAAGTLALAARDLLRARGTLFKVTEGDPDSRADWAAAAAGCLAAGGYTFWLSGIYAKGYALFYFVLALLLWRMVRAHESGRPRDFTLVAALIGLAWQAHPSATTAGLALAAYVFVHRSRLGWKGIAGRLALAALCAAGPAFLLPILSARDPAMAFGDPAGPGEVFRYLTGSRFVGKKDVFSWDSGRWAVCGEYFWEEFLGVGVAAAAAGLFWMARRNRALLAGLLLWTLPFTGVATCFTLEGQQDHWYVAAWLPLHLAAALGLHEASRRAGPWGTAVVAGVALAGCGWAVAKNYADVEQRSYRLAETMGGILLDRLEPRSILVVASDDAAAITHYLQIVRKVRPDVLVVRASHLGGTGWYEARLLRRDPSLVPASSAAALANANAPSGRAVYLDLPVPPDQVREGWILIPAGGLWRMVPREGARIDERHWQFPIEPEAVRLLFRRERGLRSPGPDGRARREAYERRMFIYLLRARLLLADWRYRQGQLEPSAALYESIVRADPEGADQVEVRYRLGSVLFALGRAQEAEVHLARTLDLDPAPQERALSLFYLGLIRRARGDEPGARGLIERALAVEGVPPAVRDEIRRRSGP